MTKREKALATIRVAGFHGDHKTALRAYVENRVSYAAYLKAWREGERAKARGVRCDCPVCKEKAKYER